MRVCNDYILVRVDPLKDKKGELFLAREGNIRTATVLQLGPGRRAKSGDRIPIDLEVGARVAFLRWNVEHRPGKTLASAVHSIEGAEDVYLIQEKDILLTWTGEDPDLW